MVVWIVNQRWFEQLIKRIEYWDKNHFMDQAYINS